MHFIDHGKRFEQIDFIKGARVQYIDVCKGLAILLVVLGHLQIPSLLYRSIFAFHIYAFFFLSGVTFKVKAGQKFCDFLKDGAKRLLIPYLFFAFAWDITNMAAQLYTAKTFDFSAIGILKNIADVLCGDLFIESSASIGPSWFLLALFIVRATFWLMAKFTKNNFYLIGIICIALFVLGSLCRGMSFLPFKIFSTLTAFFFIYCGYVSKTNLMRLKEKKIWILFLASVIAFGATFFAATSAERTLLLTSNVLPSNIFLVLAGGIFGCIGLICLAMSVEKTRFLSALLAFYGVNSLIIMGIHSEISLFFLLIFKLVGVAYLPKIVLVMIITMILSIPFSILLNKYLPFMVGRGRSRSAHQTYRPV